MNVYRFNDIIEEPITSFMSVRIHTKKFALLFQWRSEFFAFVFNRNASVEEARMIFDYATDFLSYVLNDDQYEAIKGQLRPVQPHELEASDPTCDFVSIPLGFLS